MFNYFQFITFLALSPLTFAYDGYEWSFELHSHLEDTIKCTSCMKIMDQAGKRIPALAATLGKPAAKAAVMATCTAMAAGLPFLIPLCLPLSNAAVDALAGEVDKNAPKPTPREVCEKTGMCPQC